MMRPAAEEMLSTTPPPCSSMWGRQARVSRNADVTLKRKHQSQEAASVSSAGIGGKPPALFTSTSTRPSSATASRARASSCPRSVTSHCRAMARRPSACAAAAVASISAGVRAAHTMSAPCSANASAMPRPMPRPAPVTRATFPSSRKRSRSAIPRGSPGTARKSRRSVEGDLRDLHSPATIDGGRLAAVAKRMMRRLAACLVAIALAMPARASVRIDTPGVGARLETSAVAVTGTVDTPAEATGLTLVLNGVDVTGRLRGAGLVRTVVLAGVSGVPDNPLRRGRNELRADSGSGQASVTFSWRPARRRVRVIVVGHKIDFAAYETPATWRAEVDRIFDTLVRPRLSSRRPNLVLLTEDFGLPTALIGSRGAQARAAKDSAPLVGLGTLFTSYQPQAQYYLDHFTLPGTGIGPLARALELALTDTLWRNFVPVLQAKAAALGVYLVACTNVAPAHRSTDSAAAAFFGDVDDPARTDVFLPDGIDVYNTAFVWGPDGSLLGTTRKVFLTPPEQDLLNLSSGALDAVGVLDLPIGRIGVAISLDAFVPDYVGRLDDLGATLVVQPDANPQLWAAPSGPVWQPTEWTDSILGMLQAPYPNLAFNATSMMVGGFFPGPPDADGFPTGIVFDGQSTITRRAAAPPRKSFVAMGPVAYHGEFVRVADWAFPDPVELRTGADLDALRTRCGSSAGGPTPGALTLDDRRAILEDCARSLLPGGRNAGAFH